LICNFLVYFLGGSLTFRLCNSSISDIHTKVPVSPVSIRVETKWEHLRPWGFVDCTSVVCVYRRLKSSDEWTVPLQSSVKPVTNFSWEPSIVQYLRTPLWFYSVEIDMHNCWFLLLTYSTMLTEKCCWVYLAHTIGKPCRTLLWEEVGNVFISYRCSWKSLATSWESRPSLMATSTVNSQMKFFCKLCIVICRRQAPITYW